MRNWRRTWIWGNEFEGIWVDCVWMVGLFGLMD